MTTNVATVMELLGAGDDDATARSAPGSAPIFDAARMVLHPEIPNGATSKVQRIGLMQNLGLA